MKRWKLLLSFLVTAGLAACTSADDPGEGEDLDGDGKADGGSTVSNDNLNGLWDGKLDNKTVNDVIIRSWTAIGIEVEIDGKVTKLTRTTNKLKGGDFALTIDPKAPGPQDDVITGTVAGKKIALHRDVEIKDSLTITLPKDRVYRQWLADTLAPMAQQDRESYIEMDAAKIKKFMQSTVLFKSGSFQRKYMKGATKDEQTKNLLDLIDQLDGLETTPRSIISNVTFTKAVKDHLKDQSLAGLALVNFNLYFTTGAGRSLVMPITSDSKAYFITDRPSRAEKLGLVVMDTPSHGPLASTFGRQLLDLGAMPTADNHTYALAMMNLLAKTDPTPAAQLSGVGKSALTDWFAVMAIEDYRGYSFGNADLGWGYNLTNAQFYGLVARDLGNQVIVDDQLRPGDPSYVDVLNGGNDMQEYPDMERLKTLTTDWLRAEHTTEVAAVEAAFAGIVPASELDSRAKADIFHFICAQLYHDNTTKLTATKATAAITAVVALFDAIERDHAKLETYILAHGVTKSSTPAPKSDGF